MELSKLKEPFPAEDIEWRIGRAGKKGTSIWAKCLAYVTNRAIMDRLDDICGPENWQNQYAAGPGGGIICGISINVNQSGEWVTKWDGAENTDIEAVKGGLSDAMKRCGVQWGIGRYLYNLDEGWADVSDNGKFSGKAEGTWFKWNPPKLPPWALPSTTPQAPPPQPAPTSEKPKVSTVLSSTLQVAGVASAADAELLVRWLSEFGTEEGDPKFKTIADYKDKAKESQQVLDYIAKAQESGVQIESMLTVAQKWDQDQQAKEAFGEGEI